MVVLAVLGVLVLVAIPLSFVWWRRSVHAALARELDVTVTRDPNKKPSAQGLSGAGSRSPAAAGDARFFAPPPPRTPRPPLPLRRPAGALHRRGPGGCRAALPGRAPAVTAVVLRLAAPQGQRLSGLDRFGWRVALPLALFVPPSWCKDGEAGSLLARVSAAIGGLLSSTLTTLDLLALSSTAQRAHGFGSVASATLVSASKHCRPQLLLLPPPLLLLLPGAAKTRPSSPPHADR